MSNKNNLSQALNPNKVLKDNKHLKIKDEKIANDKMTYLSYILLKNTEFDVVMNH